MARHRPKRQGVNEGMNGNYKIVKLPDRGPDGTIRFAIADQDGEIIDKGRGAGYVSPVAAHRSFGWKQRNLTYGSRRIEGG
jgi:hypothetical protein